MMEEREGRMMRIGLVGIMHESNSFAPQMTTLEHFRQDMLHVGSDAFHAGIMMESGYLDVDLMLFHGALHVPRKQSPSKAESSQRP